MFTHDPLDVRAMFISDIHLGAPACQAERAIKFLQQYRPRRLYLVGDIIDSWYCHGRWPSSHARLLRMLLQYVADKVEVVFLPGNHDAMFRNYLGQTWLGVDIVHAIVHHGVERDYLVVHGDAHDRMLWTRFLVPTWINFPRWLRRVSHWIVALGDSFEYGIIRAASQRGLTGIICGHTHLPRNDRCGEIHYLNCGDWMENCTAVVEHIDGTMELVHG